MVFLYRNQGLEGLATYNIDNSVGILFIKLQVLFLLFGEILIPPL